MTFFEELKTKVESTSNSNFYFDKLNWSTRIWIQELCELIDEKLVDEVVENDKANACFCKDWDDSYGMLCRYCGRFLPPVT